jgi:diamine N-acetyltransferase
MINLRAIEPEDIDLIYEWENDRSIWHLSSTITPFSRYLIEQYILNSENDIYSEKQLRLMIDSKESGKIITIGSIDIFDFDPVNKRAGLGIFINAAERKKGFASAALFEIIEYCFKKLGLHQLYCNITEDNEASLKLFKNAGFEICGLKKDWIIDNDKYYNEYILQLINNKKLI